MYKVTLNTIGAIIEAAKHTFPNEFIGMLGGEKKEKLINELIAVPAIFGENFSSIYTHLLPFDSKMIGTVHSHPSMSNYPSNQDLAAFGRLGEVHIIIANPFNLYSLSGYDSKGKMVRLKIIQ